MATSFTGLGCETAAEFLDSLAVSAEQIEFGAHPERIMRSAGVWAMDGNLDRRGSSDPGRPCLEWKDNIDLARRVNDFLCRER